MFSCILALKLPSKKNLSPAPANFIFLLGLIMLCTNTASASKGISPAQQVKKELYAKLDEILVTAMKSEFEVCIGGTVDRLDMVHFLKEVVKQHTKSFPDLEKILALRDTVLTARVKRAFPEVEYKRKQIRQDHFRKAYLFSLAVYWPCRVLGSDPRGQNLSPARNIYK